MPTVTSQADPDIDIRDLDDIEDRVSELATAVRHARRTDPKAVPAIFATELRIAASRARDVVAMLEAVQAQCPAVPPKLHAVPDRFSPHLIPVLGGVA